MGSLSSQPYLFSTLLENAPIKQTLQTNILLYLSNY
jgi:hypothetical protein